jgi:hypothetical protein
MLSIISWRDAEEWLEGLWSSGAVAGADLLQVRVEECIREEHRRMWRGLGGEREHGAHRGRRIGMEMPAGARSSDDKFRRPRFVLSRETKGREERGVRASYSIGY